MTDLSTKQPAAIERTALPRTNEFLAPFETLRGEIDGLFERFGNGILRSAPVTSGTGLTAKGSLMPAIDMVEHHKSFELTMEVPGLDDKDVDVSFLNGTLVIRGEKTEEKKLRDKQHFVSERRFGSFVRSFHLPAGIETDRIKARVSKGVLTVELPKADVSHHIQKQIDVSAA